MVVVGGRAASVVFLTTDRKEHRCHTVSRRGGIGLLVSNDLSIDWILVWLSS